ncbi:hypothetical protein [Arthrobacter glacialis]|uniref:hypothetical protein n=1 Tax=Arthrobacter glacialis TaxID=1664 RepID=UPI000CD3E991|nr:hypothetical protein [Arthrobacter glacialis]POH58835.1 hypothetical protein CVS28_08950 [Arthrobacter glacialis]
MIKYMTLGSGITAAVGFFTALAFQVISGVQYRIAEDQGLQPGYAPTWIVAGTNVGLLIFALGALAMLGVGITALFQRLRTEP